LFASVVSGVVEQLAFDLLGEKFLGYKIVWVIMGVLIAFSLVEILL
jgi:hypothetical protein